MTTLNFSDAIAELVRQFPTSSTNSKEPATRRNSGLLVVPDHIPLPRQPSQSVEDEVDFFDNFPV